MSSEDGQNQFNIQGYNIVTILKRLEAATSRLEDITIFQESASPEVPAKDIEGNEIKSIETPLNSGELTDKAAGGSLGSIAEAPASTAVPSKSNVIKQFESLIADFVDPFVDASKNIDPVVSECAQLLGDAFHEEIGFLEVVVRAKKPSMSDASFLKLLEPINQKISKINELKESNRTSKYINHLNTIGEGAPALGWIVSESPSMISDFKDGSLFWSNRILKEYKDKDPSHVEWVKQFSTIFDKLKDYMKEFHFEGPSWNATGKPLDEVLKEVKSVSSSSAPAPPPAPTMGGGAPPPPPPPPASLFNDDKSPASSSAPTGGMNAVFADLNKGEDITASLKKVSKSEMTHKNPELRKSAPVPQKPSLPKKPVNLSTSSSTSIPKKPAKKELVDGAKWIIENYTSADISEPIVIEAEMHHSIFIGNCTEITVHIKGKANAVSLSNSRKTSVIVDSLISGLDVIKSSKYGIQATGVVSMISVDKSDDGAIYLSQESIDNDIQIFSSSATSMNVNVLVDEDYVELAVPEQFKHTISNGKLVSEVVEHAG